MNARIKAPEGRRMSLLDLLLILIGAALAHYLVPAVQG